MITRFIACAGLAWLTTASAQPANPFPLWPNGAPGALGTNPADIPTLTPFLTARTNCAAFVICPGGAYQHLAPHEGEVYARWLNDQGIAAFVLKCRLGRNGYHHPAMLQDAARAVRLVRSQAAEWNLDPKRIGIIGSSAGGHLASTLLTHFDGGDPRASDPVERVSSRPDLGILCYPVISMGKYAHAVSRKNLLGTNPPPDLVLELSNELRVGTNTPPCFIWHTYDDSVVSAENSLLFASALRAASVPFELRIYEHGPHGQGLGVRVWPAADPEKVLPWVRDCAQWLKQRGFAN